MEIFIQLVINGLLLGGAYIIISLGLTLIFGVVRVVNFAHGEFLMVGMYLVYLIATHMGLHPYVGLIPVAVILFALGALTQKGIIQPLLNADEHIQIFAMVGVSTILLNLALVVFGANVHRAPADNPSGTAGAVLTVEFTVAGIPCIGLNGGPEFPQTEAFSFQIATDDQDETDRYWDAIVGNGGQESNCGWCKDRWGVSWQITPRALTEAMAAGGDGARRAFEAMLTMHKIDVAAIEAARRG